MVQKELLGKPATLTLEEALDEGRKQKASVSHMKQLAEAQGSVKMDVHFIKKRQKRKCKFVAGTTPGERTTARFVTPYATRAVKKVTGPVSARRGTRMTTKLHL